MSGPRHPLPRSEEARHNEIPEHLVREKHRGDDPKAAIQPAGNPVTPDGAPYRYEDLGRGPGTRGASPAGKETDMDRQSDGSSGSGAYGNAQNQENRQGRQERRDSASRSGEGFDEERGGGRGPRTAGRDGEDFEEDQAAHQDRGQSAIEAESRRP